MKAYKTQRKLAAILHADVEGYSRLMGADEETTLHTLDGHREAMATLIQQHQGVVIDTAGDSLLAEFQSVVEAVQCAVELQEMLKSRNEHLNDDQRLEFRFGINLGDVIFDKNAIYGDGVNVAARLQALAEPGGICVSGAVYDAIGNKLPLTYQSMGKQSVKNIAKPVLAYRVCKASDSDTYRKAGVYRLGLTKKMSLMATAGIVVVAIIAVAIVSGLFGRIGEKKLEVAGEPVSAQEFQNKPSIAVLPFNNISGDPAQEYFCNGMTDDIITDLTKISGLLVIARDSTFAHKGESSDIRQLAKNLNVRYILEGSVRRAGDRVRINTQLIDAVTGTNLWGERYDGEISKLFELQDKITQDVVTALEVKLSDKERHKLASPGTNNIKAYDYFLQGRDQFFYYSKDENREARNFYRKAIELDPNFASASAMLAWTHWFDFANGWSETPEDSLQLAYALAQNAIALDDALPIAYFVTGLVYREKKEYIKALVEAQKAIEIDPNYANGHVLLATLLFYAGRPEDGLKLMEKAIRIHPHHPHNYPFHVGQANYILKRYSDAINNFQQGLESHPNSERLHLWLAAAYAKSGQLDDAEWEADQVLMLNPDFSINRIKQAFPFKNPADLENLTDGLRMAGLPE